MGFALEAFEEDASGCLYLRSWLRIKQYSQHNLSSEGL